MSEATKFKLARWVKDPFVRDLLEGVGILYPHQISVTSDEDLERAGLTGDEIVIVRDKLPLIVAESE